jgi:hypothetical protein
MLRQVRPTVYETVMTPLDVLDKVNAFYATSWQHLLVFGGIAGLVLGVGFPLLFQYYQWRLFKLEEANVAQSVKVQVEQARSSLTETLRQDLAAGLAAAKDEHAADFQKLQKRMEKATAKLTGAVLHVQGAWLASTGRDFAEATRSAVKAAIAYANGEDEGNLVRSLNMLCDTCLQGVTKEQLGEGSLEDLQSLVKALEELLGPLNKTGRYQEPLKKLRAAMKAAQSR